MLILVGALLTYKVGSGLQTLQQVDAGRVLQARAGAVLVSNGSSMFDLLVRSIRYLGIVGPALLFGILISGAVRLLVLPPWIADGLGRRPVRAQLAAGVAGAPLMLCSCCMAPVFSAVYERTSRLGPSLALILAAPSLNPAALALTFMLFEPRIATARLAMAFTAVFVAAPILARLLGTSSVAVRAPQADVRIGRSTRHLPWEFARSCAHVALRTVPLILAGVLAAMWLTERLPLDGVLSPSAGPLVVGIVAVLAVPIALPTFFEIPLALTLLSAGAPAGAAATVLFAGPAINLPSLLTIARSTGWTVAAGLALAVALLALAGGLAVG